MDNTKPLILYVNHTGQVSGGEISLLGLLAHLDRTQFRLLVACPPDGPLATRLAAMDISLAPWTPPALGFPRGAAGLGAAGWGALRAARDLRRIIRHHRPALVHANSIRAALLVSLTTLRPVRLIVHVRDHLPEGWVSGLIRGWLHLRAALILAVSDYTLRQFQLHLPGRARSVVLYNAVDPARYSPEATRQPAARLRRELGLDAAYPVLAVVGQLTPWKGQDTAILAFSLLLPAYPTGRLLIVGAAKFTGATARYDTRQYQRALETLAAEEGVAGQVIFTGERADIPAVMGAVDVLLVPSWSEPFGLVVLEAMAAGKVVVATCQGGPAEIIRDGQDGVLVEPRQPGAWTSALVSLLADEPGLRRIGAAARRRVLAQFTLEQEAQRATEYYMSLLPAHHRPKEYL